MSGESPQVFDSPGGSLLGRKVDEVDGKVDGNWGASVTANVQVRGGFEARVDEVDGKNENYAHKHPDTSIPSRALRDYIAKLPSTSSTFRAKRASDLQVCGYRWASEPSTPTVNPAEVRMVDVG